MSDPSPAQANIYDSPTIPFSSSPVESLLRLSALAADSFSSMTEGAYEALAFTTLTGRRITP